MAVALCEPRQQPGLGLAEAQTAHRDRRRFELRLVADGIARIPGVLVSRLVLVPVMERYKHLAGPHCIDHQCDAFPAPVWQGAFEVVAEPKADPAASNRQVRISRSPRREMPPVRSISPD